MRDIQFLYSHTQKYMQNVYLSYKSAELWSQLIKQKLLFQGKTS